uniref:Copia-like pol polyprotein n=1 Tax=Boechera divaricarpa TaxID=115915 RepID=B6REK6_9BRAS|nr:copia-like pol polyprotein [Boechera divaricarpa]
MEVHEQFLVQFIMNSLPNEFSQFQVNYNTIKDKWNYKELKAMLVQEEGRLKMMKEQVANLVGLNRTSSSKGTPNAKVKGKGKSFIKGPERQIKKEIKCFFCKKTGHFKKDCLKRKAWFEKKGKHYSFVCSELNLIEVPNNTWWLDSGATTHVSNIKQGFSSIQPIRGAEQYLFMGNRMKALIEGIGTYRLILDTGCHVDLESCLYVPECARNLVSISRLHNFDCIKGKQTKHIVKKSATRSTQLLEIIHTDICGPFDAPSWSEIFIHEVERQLDRKVKIVRSDRGGEFYGKFTESGQYPGPFAKLLEGKGICAQYTMPGTPQQNGVAERRNRTLMDMVPSKAVPKTPFELWTGRKPSLKHLRVWGCPAEVKLYNPHEKKLDSRTVSGFFIGYPEKSKGYTFYCPNHSMRIVETGNARFIENIETSGSGKPRKVDIQEVQIKVLPPVIAPNVVVPNVQHDIVQAPLNENNVNEPVTIQEENSEPQVNLRRSIRERRSAIPSDYVVYAIESECDLSLDEDPISFQKAMKSDSSENWLIAAKEEMKSMGDNKVWDLVELPNGFRTVGSKWIFKTKRNSKGNIERYKARLVVKGFTQKDGIDYKETFSPVSKKDSLRIVLALVAHYNLELHQMDVKTAFLNGELEEEVYMDQPEGFVATGNENLVCKLRKSIYGLKQASRQWYFKFNDIITSYGFVEIIVDRCIYYKVSGRIAPIQKGDKFSEMQCPKNELERKEMKKVSYASVVGSLNYVQTCTRPDISFAVGMLGRYQSNPGMDHWKAAKKVLRYLQGTKDHMLTYRRTDHLEIIGYSDSDYAGCVDSRKSTFGYLFLLAEGAISWKSGKQSVIATSTMEAEFVACFEATLYSSQKNDKYSKGAKHMELKYLSVKEEVQKQRVSFEHIRTDMMIADPLTKGLPPKTFIGHVERMGIIDKALLF